MTPTLPVEIGGRSMTLRLDLLSMREAELTTPGLNLLHPEGWARVAESASALLAVVYGCLRLERPRPSLEWLGSQLTPADIRMLTERLIVLYATSLASAEDEEEEASASEDPPDAQPAVSPGTSSGPSAASTSASPSEGSGASPSGSSTSSPDDGEPATTETTTGPG